MEGRGVGPCWEKLKPQRPKEDGYGSELDLLLARHFGRAPLGNTLRLFESCDPEISHVNIPLDPTVRNFSEHRGFVWAVDRWRGLSCNFALEPFEPLLIEPRPKTCPFPFEPLSISLFRRFTRKNISSRAQEDAEYRLDCEKMTK